MVGDAPVSGVAYDGVTGMDAQVSVPSFCTAMSPVIRWRIASASTETTRA